MNVCPQCGTPNESAGRYCSFCGASTEDAGPDPLIGRTVGGAYLLQESVGVGGMGRVYKAEQALLGRTVAVKVIHPHLLGDDQTVARFYNEARAASRLNHPDSVSIIDFGRTDDGILYLVMEYLDGKDLAHVLADEGPLPFVRICQILAHVLSALAEAHVLGVVHRDLKPENIICRKARRGAEQVKVVDFGLAHIIGAGETSITTPGMVCGTPDYMSPEQGRGERVDGRGDLYSLGVVLFEMLTDRLPFEEDTPTLVVYQHINDPVPDPREVAPHRAIPDVLAEICIKSLQKEPADRFQSADEMHEALSVARRGLEAVESGVMQICPSCQTHNPGVQRFCGSCGSRLNSAELSLPPSMRSDRAGRTASLMPAPQLSPLVGRAAELDRLMELRARSRDSPIWVGLLGEAGVGKTRLLNELMHRCHDGGDAVAVAGPHPSGAPVPYWPIRSLLTSLLDVDAARLEQIATSEAVADPIVRAGFSEVLAPTGLVGCEGDSRVEAVGAALATAIQAAAGRSESGRVVILVDDLWRCDGLSAEALASAVGQLEKGPLFLVTSGPRRAMKLGDEVVKMLVGGLGLDLAALVLSGEAEPPQSATDRDKDTQPAGRTLLPLYLEQLRDLGLTGLDGDDTLPPRLADTVLRRLDQLEMSARRLIQAVCVLGDRAPLEWVKGLARPGDLEAIAELQRTGLVVLEGTTVTVCHPFVRDLVASSIPAEHRKQLHAAALLIAADHGAPLEVRAEHAWRAGEPMSALLLLEQMGDTALRRGDNSAAVLAFRRGLEFARRELLMSGDTSLDRAIVTFSRKLGDAMDRSGDTNAADGVLREALEWAGPADGERTKMLLLLSRVARRRSRQRDAMRFLGKTLELAARQKDPEGAAQAHYALGRLRLDDGDARTALGTLDKALELVDDRTRDKSLEVKLLLVRAEAMQAVGDSAGASASLDSALAAAHKAASPACIANVMAAIGARVAASEPQLAAEHFREAGRLAASIGDAERSRAWYRRSV